GKSVLRVLGRDRFASRRNFRRRAVRVVTVAHRAIDSLDEVGRRDEAERDRVSDVQVTHLRAGRLDPLGLGDDVANRVREAVDAGGSWNSGLNIRRGHVADCTFERNCVSFTQPIEARSLDSRNYYAIVPLFGTEPLR